MTAFTTYERIASFTKCVGKAAGDEAALEVLRKIALLRTEDAERIPWPALAESWRRDLDRIEDLIDETRGIKRGS